MDGYDGELWTLSYPLVMPAMAMTVPAGVSQVEEEVIVLIAGAWRLDWDLGRDIKGGGVCCDVKGSRNAGYWYGRYDTDQAQGVAAVAVSTRAHPHIIRGLDTIALHYGDLKYYSTISVNW